MKTTSSIIKVPNDIKTIAHYIFNYSTPVWVPFLADIRKDLLRVMYRMSNGRDPDGQSEIKISCCRQSLMFGETSGATFRTSDVRRLPNKFRPSMPQ